MAIDTVGIPLAYLIISSLLLWIIIAARGSWWVKAGAITICTLFAVGLWHSLDTLQGWPTDAEMPARFEIKWLVTEEPNRKTGSPGTIYVWAGDLDPRPTRPLLSVITFHRKGRSGEPRIYRLPYSRPLHEQSEEIQKKISGGGRFFGTMRAAGIMEEGTGGGGRGKGQGRGTAREGKALVEGEGGGDEASLSYHQDYLFQELPPPRFPEKDAP